MTTRGTHPKPKFLMAGEVANILGVDRRTVYRMIHRKQLPVAATTSTGHYLFGADDVKALAAELKDHPPRRGRPVGFRPPKKKRKTRRNSTIK